LAGRVGQPIAAAGRLPFANQPRDVPARGQLLACGLRTIQSPADLVADQHLQLDRPSPQQADISPDFIYSVVHAWVLACFNPQWPSLKSSVALI
jgi:hypothetical protein